MSVFNFHEHAVIPMTALEELDDIKDRKCVASEARIGPMVDEVLGHSTPEAIAKGGKTVALKGDSGNLGYSCDSSSPLADESRGRLDDIESNDNRIINCALEIQNQDPSCDVILVRNYQHATKGFRCLNRVEDYRRDQLVSDVELTTGYLEFRTNFETCHRCGYLERRIENVSQNSSFSIH